MICLLNIKRKGHRLKSCTLTLYLHQHHLSIIQHAGQILIQYSFIGLANEQNYISDLHWNKIIYKDFLQVRKSVFLLNKYLPNLAHHLHLCEVKKKKKGYSET